MNQCEGCGTEVRNRFCRSCAGKRGGAITAAQGRWSENLATGRTPEARQKAAEKTSKPIGSKFMSKGYVFVKTEDGWVREHRLVAGVGALPGHKIVVHHRNERKDDNSPENLEVTTRGEHTRHHATARPLSEETRQNMRAYALSPEGREVKRRAGSKGGGSNRNPVTPEEVAALAAEGMTLDQMAARLQVGIKVIRNRLREASGLRVYGRAA